jgi:hypothetical protein
MRKENKSAVRDFVDSGTERDLAWDKKEAWRRAEEFV